MSLYFDHIASNRAQASIEEDGGKPRMTVIKAIKRAVQLGTVVGYMAIVAMIGGLSPAKADGYSLKEQPAPATDAWANHWLVRARASFLVMRDDIDNAHLTAPINLPPANIVNGQLPGSGADITNQLIPELDVSYFLTNNIAVEVICCVTKHSVNATGALGNSINSAVAALTGTGAGTEVASAWALPATILFQYHHDMGGGFKPYVGAGPTYGIFVNEKVGAGLQPVTSKVEVQNTWGFTLQAGADVAMGGNWFLNLDAKYMYLQPDVTWTGKTGTALDGVSLIAEDLQLDPWILSVGLGYKF